MIETYTWGEYLASLPAARSSAKYSGGDWTDGETFASALAKMAHGDDTYASLADQLLDRLNDVTEGVPMREWTPCPYGAYPVIPEFLAGHPACMRVMSPSGEPAPVKIVVSTTCSGGTDKQAMTERGAAILALVQKLQAIRPVELYVLVEGNDEKVGDNLFQLISIDTKPLSIAHACFALANVGFARTLTYTHMRHYHDWVGNWPRSYHHADYESIVRTECQMAPDDLWIRSAHLLDALMRDPVSWVNAQLARYGTGPD